MSYKGVAILGSTGSIGCNTLRVIDELGEERDRTAVSVVRSVGDEVRIYEKANFLGTILDDVGLPRPEAQDDEKFATTATEERIPDLDGDVMFLSRFGDDHRLLGRLQDNRLWSRLRVVRAERVYEVPDEGEAFSVEFVN